jgi:hypothetical protein
MRPPIVSAAGASPTYRPDGQRLGAFLEHSLRKLHGWESQKFRKER